MKTQKFYGLTINIFNSSTTITRNVLEAFLINFFNMDTKLKGNKLTTAIRNDFGIHTINIVQVMPTQNAFKISKNWWEEAFAVKNIL